MASKPVKAAARLALVALAMVVGGALLFYTFGNIINEQTGLYEFAALRILSLIALLGGGLLVLVAFVAALVGLLWKAATES